MRSNRQQQIVQMVHGYDSTFTISVALRNVFLLWVLYGLALIVFGILALVANPLSESGATTQRTVGAIRGAVVVPLLFTFVLCGGWVAKSMTNVRRLGRKASIGVLARIRRHILAACFGFVAVMFALFIPQLALLLFIAAFALFFYSQMWLHLWLLDIVRMLWRSSSPPNGQQEDVDHYVLIWFWSWVVFISCLVTDASAVDVNTRTIDTLTIVSGMACVVSALLASRLVIEISKRQDARLFAVIHEVDDEQNAKPVTDQDIAAAWSRSAGMIDIPR